MRTTTSSPCPAPSIRRPWQRAANLEPPRRRGGVAYAGACKALYTGSIPVVASSDFAFGVPAPNEAGPRILGARRAAKERAAGNSTLARPVGPLVILYRRYRRLL